MIAALALSACGRQQNTDDPVVARAYDQFLRWSDLRRSIPVSATPEDSAARAQAIVDAWLREQVVIHKAEQNLKAEEKDFEVRMRDYRNSLIVYAYERALIEQKLDTAIGEEEIARYYQDNKKNFELKDNIVRVRWFKTRENDRRMLARLEKWFQSADANERHELEVWIAEHAAEVHDSGPDRWLFKDLVAATPVHAPNPVDYLSAHAGHPMVLKDSSGTYFIEILEHRLQNSVSPLGMVRDEIRAVLLNQRKQLLIQRMRDDLYREAREKKEGEPH